MDMKLDKSHQYALVAKKNKSILGCTGRNTVSRSREVILPSTQPWGGHTLSVVSVVGCPAQERYGATGKSPARNITKRLMHLSDEKRLRELGLLIRT